MKFRECLNESNLEMVVKKIAKLTSDNDHNQARIEGAKFLKLKKYQKVYEGFDNLSNIYGGMSHDMLKVRDDVDKKMLAVAKRKLKPEEYKKLHSVF